MTGIAPTEMEYDIFYPVYSVALLVFVLLGSKFLAYLSKRRAFRKTGQLEIEKVRYLMAATELYNSPMGLLYSSHNGYHDVAIRDLARVIQQEAERMHKERVRKNLI